MGAVWCMTANDGGTTKTPLGNYRAIAACFEALPGRIIPVDLAPVTISAPMALATGDLVDAPCDLPASIPELFNVRNADPNVIDLGPICTFLNETDGETDTCSLEVRGRFFGFSPNVFLRLPDEQLNSPQASGKSPPPVVSTPTESVNYTGTSDHHYDSVCERIGMCSSGCPALLV